MKQKLDELSEWLNHLKDFSLPSWDELPEMELYMDQVMSYLSKKLNPIFDDNIDKTLTPYMINNYVKANLIDAPVHKKYSKSQLGYLLGICLIKQILSISDILFLYESNEGTAKEKDQLYTFLKRVQDDSIKKESEYVSSRIDIIQKRYNDEIKRAKDDIQKEKAENFAKENLSLIALRLSIEAEAKKVIADHILSIVKNNNFDVKLKKKEKKIAKKATKTEAKTEAKRIKIVAKK